MLAGIPAQLRVTPMANNKAPGREISARHLTTALLVLLAGQ